MLHDTEPPPPPISSGAELYAPERQRRRISIAGGGSVATLRGLLARLACAGFDPPPRLVIAVDPDSMPALAAAILLIAEVRPVLRLSGPMIPRAVGTIWLGEGFALELVCLPVDEAFVPTWPLALTGAAAIIDASQSGLELLQAHADMTGLRVFRAESLLGAPPDIASPVIIAEMVRGAVEAVVVHR